MAITTIQSPQGLMPAYNQNIWVFDSTNKTQQQFRYVIDIYDESNNFILRERIAPEPTYGYGYVDLSRILSSNVSYDINISATQSEAPNSYFGYKIKPSEEFLYTWEYWDTTFVGSDFTRFQGTESHLFQTGDIVTTDSYITSYFTASTGTFTVLTTGTNSFVVNLPFVSSPANGGIATYANRTKTSISGSTSSTYYVFNGRRSTYDFIDWDSTEYIIPQGPTTSKKLLTDIPSEFYCTPEQDIWFNMFRGTESNSVISLQIETSDGDTLRYNYFWSTGEDRVTQLACGPNNIDYTSVISGTGPVVKSTTEWYDVYLWSAVSPQLSNKYRIYLDRRCKIEDYEILFMDRMGSFVSYAFQLRSKETGNIERKSYNKFLGEIGSSGWSQTSDDAGETIYHIDYSKELELNTNWMNDDMSVYFEQLLTSPVTLLKVDGVYIPVIVTDNGFETIRQKNKTLIKKSVKIRFANKEIVNI